MASVIVSIRAPTRSGLGMAAMWNSASPWWTTGSVAWPMMIPSIGLTRSSGSSPNRPVTRASRSPFRTGSPLLRTRWVTPPRGALTQLDLLARAGMPTSVRPSSASIMPRWASTRLTPATPVSIDSRSKRSASPASISSMSTPFFWARSRKDPSRSGLSMITGAPKAIANSTSRLLPEAMRICGRLYRWIAAVWMSMPRVQRPTTSR